MAGTFKFHSKLHRDSHHTVAASNSPDAALDPIASQQLPFAGIFYNNITDSVRSFSIQTNSLQWWATYNTVFSLSSNWNNTYTLYSTVNSLSDNWNDGYSGYVSFKPNSASFIAVYTTVRTYSAEWNTPFIMYVHEPQEYTASKTFSGTNLTFAPGTSSVFWDLSSNQSTFLTMDRDLGIANPTNMRRGGHYTLTCTQNVVGNWDLKFGTSYRFNGTTNQQFIIDTTPRSRTVITFVCDGTLMYGDVTKFNE